MKTEKTFNCYNFIRKLCGQIFEFDGKIEKKIFKLNLENS